MMSMSLDGRCDAVVDALQAEFGAILAARIFETEAADFLWEARVKERYLGQHFALGEGAQELSRVALLSEFAGSWHSVLCLVDGDGRPVELLCKQAFDRQDAAMAAFDRAT
jgi:hypothetical protein